MRYIPNTKIIHNPRADELPVGLLDDLKDIGVVQPLRFGKDKGFRVEFYSPESRREEVEKILLNYGITIEKSTEHLSPERAYLNINIIRIPRKREVKQLSLFTEFSNTVIYESGQKQAQA